MLFLHCTRVFWPPIGISGLLAASSLRQCFSSICNAFNLPWLVGSLGLIFAPWTALMYVMVFPLNGFDWIWLGFGIIADIVSYVGAYHNRKQVPMYPETAP